MAQRWARISLKKLCQNISMNIAIVGACRTPIGRFLGSLAGYTAIDLATVAISEVLTRAGLLAPEVPELYLGQVLQAGCGQNPARQVGVRAGLALSHQACTINQVCGSGMRAIMWAAQSIQLGETSIALAGGMESMSQAPYLLPQARRGYRAGHAQMQDVVLQDGLWCALSDQHMGQTAEWVAEYYRIGRAQQDVYALESHRRAVAAQPQYLNELVALPELGQDEAPRPNTSLEKLAQLKPAFCGEGTVTAGNAPGLSDGAAALLLMSETEAHARGIPILARIVGYAASGLAPQQVMMTPVPAIQQLMQKMAWSVSSVDVWEINEAFAVQSLAVIQALHLDPGKVNMWGGAVALGHPIGASGARIVVSLAHQMQQAGWRRGVASLCMGGGQGLALALSREGL